MKTCKHCKDTLIKPIGNKKSPVLLVGEFPGWKELKYKTPFIGQTGDILKKELFNHGVDWKSCRITNLWLHAKRPASKDCLEYHYQLLLKECIGKKAILLMGSDTAKRVIGKNIMSVTGMRIEIINLSAPLIVASVNPAQVTHGTLGEFRLAIQRFTDGIKEKEILK